MAYVDGFVIPVHKDKLEDYKAIAAIGCAVWMDHGARSYAECIGDDVPYGTLTSFPRAVQAGDDEIVVFSWIVYDSREHRDAVNARVMEDPRMKETVATTAFDGKRMIFGGFVPFIQR